MSDWGPMVFWHWWILSGVLLILELTSPIFFFLWVSIAAAAVGFLLLIIPGMSLEIQLVSFGIMSVVNGVCSTTIVSSRSITPSSMVRVKSWWMIPPGK